MRMWSGSGSFQDRRVEDQRALPDIWEVGVASVLYMTGTVQVDPRLADRQRVQYVCVCVYVYILCVAVRVFLSEAMDGEAGSKSFAVFFPCVYI